MQQNNDGATQNIVNKRISELEKQKPLNTYCAKCETHNKIASVNGLFFWRCVNFPECTNRRWLNEKEYNYIYNGRYEGSTRIMKEPEKKDIFYQKQEDLESLKNLITNIEDNETKDSLLNLYDILIWQNIDCPSTKHYTYFQEQLWNALINWRKQKSIQETLPESYIADIHLIYDIVSRVPQSLQDLEEATNHNSQFLSKYSKEIMDIIEIKINDIFSYDPIYKKYKDKNHHHIIKYRNRSYQNTYKISEHEVIEYVSNEINILDTSTQKEEMGYCHVFWGHKKNILKKFYNIDWETPSEENPHILYD